MDVLSRRLVTVSSWSSPALWTLFAAWSRCRWPIAERGAGVPDDRRIVFRIGVNLDDEIIEDNDIFGDGVNAAARLQEIL
jgi:class 3 adenylate cyclase